MNINNYTNATKVFPNLCEEVKNNKNRRIRENSFYIENGYCETWNDREKVFSDNGLKRYSTETRWNQYKSGKITREKAVEFAIKRAAKEQEKIEISKIQQLENAAVANDFDSVSIYVQWARSRTWGANPTAEVYSNYNNTTRGHASGCGYDKESAAIAEALNLNNSAMRVLYSLAESALANGESPESKTACTGYSWNKCIGYGSGYGVLPHFEGGVGSSCFFDIFRKAGYVVNNAGSGKMFDCYTLYKKEA